MKDWLIGITFIAVIGGIPLLGCVLAVVYQSMWWLVLLLPLFALHEAGLFLAVVAFLVVAYFVP